MLNSFITYAKSFCLKQNINIENDFNFHHRKRLKLNKFDSNPHSQVQFTLDDFYRKEFTHVLDTLINLSTENLKSCLVSIQPIFKIYYQFP